jgi:translation initiation factor IF-2
LTFTVPPQDYFIASAEGAFASVIQESRLQREKVRIYALARELNIDSKDLVDLCKQAGLDVKNQLSSLDPEQRDAVELLVRRGGAAVAVAAPPKAAGSSIPTLLAPVPNLSSRPARREPEAARPAAVSPAKPAGAVPPTPTPADEGPPVLAAKISETQGKSAESPTSTGADTSAARPPEVAGRSPDVSSQMGGSAGRVRDLSQPRAEGTPRPQRKREIPRPAVARVASPPPLKQRPLAEAKPQEQVQKPIARPPESLRGGPINVQNLQDKGAGAVEVPAGADLEDEEGGDRKGSKVKPGGVAGRDKRHAQRNERARLRKDRAEVERPSSRMLLPVDDDRPQRVKQRLRQAQQRQRGPTQPRKGKVPIFPPITVRSLSEAVGVRSIDLMFRLKETAGPNLTINSTLDTDMAEALALDLGCELEIKRPQNVESELLESLQQPEEAENLVARAPVVAVMGHVDHGKTSLLDKIRQSDIVATEAGGITQVIRAWRVDHGGRPITFLDTPGHEAFTKMRARGAQVTDIAVIVVAADDGVMPQTEEAINHARAAGVPIVIAINKVDLPNANTNKTRQQLYALQVLPDNMGGDTPFVETSAATGKGIDELLDNLSVVAETLLELKANPTKAASGTCLEAMLSEGEGVRATLLVQDGTLNRGDVILCGATYGRVRAMYDDLGRPIEQAGPSVPVRVTGLNEVPNADDPFQAVPDLAVAREIADKRMGRLLESGLFKREPARLESLGAAKIVELKVILKADFRGSVEAIRKEMEKLYHEEVRVRILHAAIGGITESDVQLALTSPKDTIIVGFNVVPDDRAKALAEEKGIQIRQYDIIYHLTDDIRAALEGKLKPREEVVQLGRAVVRKTFKISRVGTVAGCFVTQGVIERSAKVRLIREGIVVYPPADRTAGLDSLKRVKDDVREVREGFECGIKIAGYDDVKVGDVIEAFRIEQIQRTL